MVSSTDNSQLLNIGENIMTVFQFVGVDVAKDKFDIALLKNKQFLHQSFNSHSKGYQLFLKWIKKHTTSPWICMEATGHYSEIIAEYLIKNNIKVSIVNPLQIKSFARVKLSRNKNDIVDAQIIAEYCEKMHPNVFAPRSEMQKELRDLTKLLDTLKDQLVRLKNQAESMQGKLASKALQKSIQGLKKEIEQINEQLDKLVQSNKPLAEKVALITSIKGVGKITAHKILARISDINCFSNAKQFAAYIGISPKQHQSGKFQGKTTISRMGDSQLRKALYMAALVAKNTNEALQPFVKRLEERGKAPKSIVCAVMRKLAHIIFGILKHKHMFNAALV
jgi:transposase